MKKNTDEILKLCKKVFKKKNVSVNSSIDEIDSWDSVNHVTLIALLEKKFKIIISFEESISISSIKDIVKIIKKVR